jgi:hypothetical protein
MQSRLVRVLIRKKLSTRTSHVAVRVDLKENFVKLQLIHVRLVRAATVVIVSFQKVPRTMCADVIHLLLEKIVKHTTIRA